MSLSEKKIDKQHTDALLAARDVERRKRDIYRSDSEKLRLFTKMLRLNIMYRKAKITHK